MHNAVFYHVYPPCNSGGYVISEDTKPDEKQEIWNWTLTQPLPFIPGARLKVRNTVN